MGAALIRKTEHPAYLQFYPTLNCNMACSFCFNRKMGNMPHAAPEDVQTMVSVAERQGIGHIDFLGGEPTLHPDLGRMIAMVASAGLKSSLSSNGTRPEMLMGLSARFPENVLQVGISVNDAPPGARLLDYIHQCRPIVKTLFSGRTDVFDAASFAEMDTGRIPLRLIYRDAVTGSDLHECARFPDYYERLNKMRGTMPNLEGVYCSGFLPDPDFGVLETVRCPAGTTKLSVRPDGEVYPCYLFFPYPAFRLGNLLVDDFRSIWENPRLDAFRHFETNQCPEAECCLFDRCHGGCPAAGWMLNGGLRSPDPRCRPFHTQPRLPVGRRVDNP